MTIPYRVHKSTPLDLVLRPVNAVQTFALFFRRSSVTISSHLHLGLLSGLFPSDFQANFVLIFHLSQASYVPPPPIHRLLLDHPNNIRRSVKVTKLFIIQSSVASDHFIPFRTKYSPQHPVFAKRKVHVLKLQQTPFRVFP
jgi:hypothetical protein